MANPDPTTLYTELRSAILNELISFMDIYDIRECLSDVPRLRVLDTSLANINGFKSDGNEYAYAMHEMSDIDGLSDEAREEVKKALHDAAFYGVMLAVTDDEFATVLNPSFAYINNRESAQRKSVVDKYMQQVFDRFESTWSFIDFQLTNSAG